MTILYDPARKKEPPCAISVQYTHERDQCMKYFEKWTEPEQVHFVEQLLARMCHYQHGHINAYLKPMLQRDFISLLPSKYTHNPSLCDFQARGFVGRCVLTRRVNAGDTCYAHVSVDTGKG